MNDDFVGVGWPFPLKSSDRIELASGEPKIEQAIQIILGTLIGQRVMRPTFGSRLHELVFAPITAETLGLAEMYVAEALRFWEPRIALLDVHAAADSKQQNTLCITIRYRVKHSSDERSLVYPFYRIPGDA